MKRKELGSDWGDAKIRDTLKPESTVHTFPTCKRTVTGEDGEQSSRKESQREEHRKQSETIPQV